MKKLFLIPILLSGAVTAPAETFRGPLPEEQQDIIHYMAEHHTDLSRTVTMTETGYRAITTTGNKELVKKLHAHVAYMKKRLDSGAMVRRWDPAYAEMVEHYKELDAKITPIEKGLEVTVSGKTPRAMKIARNHANIVTSFAKEGFPSVERKHPDTTQLKGDEEKATATEPSKQKQK